MYLLVLKDRGDWRISSKFKQTRGVMDEMVESLEPEQEPEDRDEFDDTDIPWKLWSLGLGIKK